jgi:hypothetical protein
MVSDILYLGTTATKPEGYYQLDGLSTGDELPFRFPEDYCDAMRSLAQNRIGLLDMDFGDKTITIGLQPKIGGSCAKLEYWIESGCPLNDEQGMPLMWGSSSDLNA